MQLSNESLAEFALLTDREREVAIALALGLTNREIARDLDINIKTVDTHRGHVMKKLGCRNNVLLTFKALRLGWISLDNTPGDHARRAAEVAAQVVLRPRAA